MTGTASSFNDYNATETQPNLISRVSNWVSGHQNTTFYGCKLIDISECGGALLIPNNLVMPYDTFSLIITDSDDNNKSPTILRAELRWSDLDYSEKSIKLGFKIQRTSASKQRAIKHLMKQASTMENIEFSCNMTFHNHTN